MQKLIAPAALLTALAALLTAAWALSRDPSTTHPDAAAPSLEQHQELQRRVARLEQQLKDLDSASPAAARPLAAANDLAAPPRERLRALAQAQDDREEVITGALEEEGSEVRQKVQDIVRDELELRQEEEHLRRVTRMKERLKERVAEFTAEHKLSTQQQKALEDTLLSEREEIMTLMDRNRRADGDFSKVREQIEARRAQTDAQAEAILDGDALQRYRDLRAEEANRWGRGPGGPGGPRGF
jgi:chromosome segregation ATPase